MIKPGWVATSGFYGFFFLAMGAQVPFLPIWLGEWGLSTAEIGLYGALGIAVRVAVGLALPWLADRFQAPRRLLAISAALSALFFCAHLFVETRPFLLLVTLLASAAWAGITPIGDALSLRAAERGGFDYAPARSVGSAAFVVANLLCGAAMAGFGVDVVIWWIALSFLPLILLGRWHPGGAGAEIARPKLTEAGRLIRAPAFALAMIAGAAAQGAHMVLYAYGSIGWRDAGYGEEVIGALWAFGVVVEVVVMAVWGKALIARLGPAGALMLSGAAGLFRWAAMSFDPSLIWLWPLQALHGLTFTAAYLGVIAFVNQAAPARLAATAQGMTGSLATGIAMAAVAGLAAWVYPLFGAGAYWLAAGVAVIGFVAAAALARVWDGAPLAVGEEAR